MGTALRRLGRHACVTTHEGSSSCFPPTPSSGSTLETVLNVEPHDPHHKRSVRAGLKELGFFGIAPKRLTIGFAKVYV